MHGLWHYTHEFLINTYPGLHIKQLSLFSKQISQPTAQSKQLYYFKKYPYIHLLQKELLMHLEQIDLQELQNPKTL